MVLRNFSFIIVSLVSTILMAAEIYRFDILVDKPGASISPTMYGLFFEDINYGADGGLYAEMIKNRSFEFPNPFDGWHIYGSVSIKDDGPFPRNPHYVTLSDSGHKEKWTGLDNDGFFGVSFKKGKSYRLTVYARVNPQQKCQLTVQLVDPSSNDDTQIFAEGNIDVDNDEWTKYSLILSPNFTIKKGRLRIFLNTGNQVDLEHISLFPTETYNGDENGLRRDLVELLADMKPGVFRFPGGCIVEGTDLSSRYQWKHTVGPVENRPLNINRWQYTFRNRFYPDYYQSNGLGFYEYFRLAEELGASPLPVLNVGLVCQYQNDTPEAHVPIDSLAPYVQDALDLIEFANGDTATVWGGLRAQMGHPNPFNLKYIAIGNEQWGQEYVDRLKVFTDILHEAHPEIEIVGSSGPEPDGDKFDYLWPEMEKLKVNLVDEHYYKPEDWFLSQGLRYDNYDRRGPKVFAGEYACHSSGYKRNNFHAALCEAAFMTSLERNADIVRMATYAPLFAHVEGWQWRPDMIWFDNLESFTTASYHVQKLYGNYSGTRVLPLIMCGEPVAGGEHQSGLFASATIDDTNDRYIIKVANTSSEKRNIEYRLIGIGNTEKISTAHKLVLHSNDERAENSIDYPDIVKPIESYFEMNCGGFEDSIPAKSFQVYIIPSNK